jgi:hypothetical protein
MNLQVRLPVSARSQLEARVENLRREHPGLHISVASLVRDLVLRELRAESMK